MTLAESTVLVVDDEPVLRLTFSVLLQQTGARVIVASDGVEALRVLETQRVDVVLTDKQMPHMDGLTLLKELRVRGFSVPAVFFVNGVLSEDHREMDRLGVVRTVTKPLQPSDLVR
ncbi:MAG TPA: response regulator, partial [Terriglobus sp.]